MSCLIVKMLSLTRQSQNEQYNDIANLLPYPHVCKACGVHIGECTKLPIDTNAYGISLIKKLLDRSIVR